MCEMGALIFETSAAGTPVRKYMNKQELCSFASHLFDHFQVKVYPSPPTILA